MGEVVRYHQISFDTAHIARPGEKVRYFEATPYPHVDGSARVTELDEKPLVRWLMLCPLSRQIILAQLGLPPDALHRPEVVEPFYAEGEGDVDLILCGQLSPHQAFALECKRVKIEIVNAGQDRINKLHGVAAGVWQANKLYNGRFPFFQTYLAIITEVEASGLDGWNIPSRGVRSHSTPLHGDTRTTTFRQIVEFPGRDDLNDDIGILFIEVAQPSRISIDKQATVRVCRYRSAEPRDQPDSITKRVLEVFG